MARSRKAKGKPAAGKRRIEQYDHNEGQRDRSTVGLEGGDHKRVAVKIVDDRGIESLKIIPVP